MMADDNYIQDVGDGGAENKKALVLLHEIYGLNRFISEQKKLYIAEGYDVYCPDMIKRSPFEYSESEAAYAFFMKNIGFGVCDEISLLVQKLKGKYERTYIVGYSIGATIAWLCSDIAAVSGVVACYGSRIRDYARREPLVPTLLILARFDHYDVEDLKRRLINSGNLSIEEFEAEHGFLDPYSEQYDLANAVDAEAKIREFLKRN